MELTTDIVLQFVYMLISITIMAVLSGYYLQKGRVPLSLLTLLFWLLGLNALRVMVFHFSALGQIATFLGFIVVSALSFFSSIMWVSD